MSKTASKIRFDHFLGEVLRITHETHNSHHINLFFIILSFLQLSSFLFKLSLSNFHDQRPLFFLNITFYTNFSNFLLYFASDVVTYLFLVFALIIVNFLMFYPIILVMIRKKMFFQLEDCLITSVLDIIYGGLMQCFHWVLMLPILDLAVNIVTCSSPSFLNGCPGSMLLWLPCCNICLFVLFFGIVHLWLYKDDSFLAEDTLKRSLTFGALVIFLLKFAFVILIAFASSDSKKSLIYSIFTIIVFLSICDYLLEFPYRNHTLNRLYASFLCAFVGYLFVFMLFDYSPLVKEDDFVYVQAVFTLFGFKLGQKLQETRYFLILRSNFKQVQFRCFLLEELIFLFQNVNLFQNKLLLKGVFQRHIRYCKIPNCKLRAKHIGNYEDLNDLGKMKILNDYICYVFSNSIETAASTSNASLRPSLEKHIVKYASFLVNFNANCVKAFFEVQKLLFKFKKLSFYFKCLKNVVIRDIRSKISDNEKEKKLIFSSVSGLFDAKELYIADFLDIVKEKRRLDRLATSLLKEKIVFWDKYKDGLQNYQESLHLIRKLANKIADFESFLSRKQLKHSKAQSIFLFKYRSFLQCILLNNINEAVKAEEEVDCIRRREHCQDPNILSFSSFFDDSLASIQVSFLTNRGEILESSKNTKLGQVFGYESQEIKQLKLYDLMPDFLAEAHDMFFEWFLNRQGKTNEISKKYTEVFAKHKSGAVFPVRLFIGQAFEINDDFIMHAVIKPLEKGENKEKCIVFDETGGLQGVNQDLFGVFSGTFKEIKVKELNLLNVYSLVPNLQVLLEKNRVFEERNAVIIRNQYASFLFPKNLMDILEVLRLKKKQDKMLNINNSHYSSRTSKKSMKSIKSMKSSASSHTNNKDNNSFVSPQTRQTQFMTKLYNTKFGLTVDRRNALEEKCRNNTLTNKDIIDELLDKNALDRLCIAFDLKVFFYSYGAKQHQKLCLVSLIIKRTKLIPQGLNSTEITDNNRFNSNFNLMKNNSMTLLVKKEEDTLHENSQVSDVPTNFVKMPPENIPEFGNMSNSDRELSDLNINFPPALEEPPSSKNQVQNIETPKNPIDTIEIEKEGLSPRSHDQIDSPQRKQEIIRNMPTHQNLLNVSVALGQMEPNSLVGNNIDPNSKNDEQLLENCPSFHTSQSNEVNQKKPISSKGDVNNVDLDLEKRSASSVTGLNKTYSIFKTIANIQTQKPREILVFSTVSLLEVLFATVYCIVVYQFTVKYVTSYYTPLEDGLQHVSSFTTSIYTAALVSIELEMYKRNLTYVDQDSLGYDIIYKMLENTFLDARTAINSERAKIVGFNYQYLLNSATLFVVDSTFGTNNSHSFNDFIDSVIQTISDLSSTSFSQLSLSQLQFISINFRSFDAICSQVINEIKQEFTDTNTSTSVSLLVVMLTFLAVISAASLWQIKSLLSFFARLVKVLDIFLRVNEKAALNELFFLREIKTTCFDDLEAKNVLSFHFPELLTLKKSFEVVSQKDLNPKKGQKDHQKQKHKYKKSSLHSLKPLSLISQKLFVMLCFGVLFSYLFFIYLYWTIIDKQLTQVISFNNFFNVLYSMPSLLQVLSLITLRNQILNTSQNSNEAYFSQELNTKISDFDQMAINLPSYVFSAQASLDNFFFNQLVSGDICKLMLSQGTFDSTEAATCGLLLDQAFTMGIIQTYNQLINEVKTLQQMNIAQIKVWFLDSKSLDVVVNQHFIQEINTKFIGFMSEYYQGLINAQIDNMKLVLLLTTCLIGVMGIVMASFGLKKYGMIYREVAMGLSVIPYERLINDEQTGFLIKQLLK